MSKLCWDEKHIPISVGVGFNVPGYAKGVCFVNANLDKLLDEMLTAMYKIAKKAETIQKINLSTSVNITANSLRYFVLHRFPRK